MAAREIQRLHAFISGTVQGIGFRWYVMQAVKLRMPSIVGWIRNLRDGRVELTVEGTIDDLDRLLDVLNVGPTGANVSLVTTEFTAAKGDMHGFDATYDE